MDEPPSPPSTGDIHYARNGGVAIAYQVVGEGDTDLVYVSGWVSNLVYGWESPLLRAFYLRLAQSFRLILFDKRGTGISDHGDGFATLETRMEDLRAVLDAAGAARPVVFGANEGCAISVLFAASYPERTRGLVLFHPFVTGGLVDASPGVFEDLADIRAGWGMQQWCDELLSWGCPPLAASEEHRRRFANGLRVGASPASAYALNRAANETDLRHVLPTVHVPTLLLHRRGHEAETAEVASQIRNARTIRVSGEGYFGIFLSEDVADEIERFVAAEAAPSIPETVLATVMFTDIVESTAHAARIGDHAWRALLSQHHAVVRREISEFRGQERDTSGDGFFATFDGPARAIAAAKAISAGVRGLGLSVRIGIHVGECEVHEEKLTGLAVVIGARIKEKAGADQVLVSQTVRDLVAGSGVALTDAGVHGLKGVPGRWRVYAVSNSDVTGDA